MKHLLIMGSFLSLFSFKAKAQVDINTLIPINEMGTSKYQGYTGGLYPDGSNTMPPAFFNDAVLQAQAVQPLDANGQYAADGKIGLITIGASTVAMFSEGIEKQIDDVKNINTKIVFVNGGIGGQEVHVINDKTSRYWQAVDGRITSAGLSKNQVQIIWYQEDDLRNKTAAFPERANILVDEFKESMLLLKERFPNLKFVYLTARHTTEYMPAEAKDKHKEPRPYQNGWACKFLIEAQINGEADLNFKGLNAPAPMIVWGPYFWTQGEKTRSDGYAYPRNLSTPDGVHPNEGGKLKVGKDLIDFWSSDAVSKIWFLNDSNIPVSAEVDNSASTSMQFLSNGTEIDRLSSSEVKGAITLLVLKDSMIVSNNQAIAFKSKYIFDALPPATYKYVLKDEGTLLKVGSFTINEDYSVDIIPLTQNATMNTMDINTQAEDIKQVGTDEADSSAVTHREKKSLQPVPEDQPGWIANGKNKMDKLKRLLSTQDAVVKAVVMDSTGKQLLVVEDVLHKHTDLNKVLQKGNYKVDFYDVQGDKMKLSMDVDTDFQIK